MQRRFNKPNMPNDPQRTGVQGAAQTTPSIVRRFVDPRRRSSVRSLQHQSDAQSRSSDKDTNSAHLGKTGPEERMSGDPQARLLSRRKQYSQNKVPTIALDETELSTSTPNIPVQHTQQTGSLVSRLRYTPKIEAYSTSTSPLYPNSPKETVLSHVDIPPRMDLGVGTQRALSASPSKLAATHASIVPRPRPRLINSSGSVDSVGQTRTGSYYYPGKAGFLSTHYGPVAKSPLCTPSESSPLPTTPGTTHSVSPVALSPASAHSTTMSPTSWVQQRSTESHESSVSMPSATSSGSGGLILMLGRGKYGRLGSRELNRSTENPPVMEVAENMTSRHESHSLQRRSSYEVS
ncbi:unnamed protein product [Echinostoma caproni]|uniref:Similar to n=1 Tax=Echinostoma caproni TaxID=27848 RepID=A0A183AEP0_9TREM|nr:unnamed protein product [Echinostoma caproni]